MLAFKVFVKAVYDTSDPFLEKYGMAINYEPLLNCKIFFFDISLFLTKYCIIILLLIITIMNVRICNYLFTMTPSK